MGKLNPCPFCGNTNTVVVSCADEKDNCAIHERNGNCDGCKFRQYAVVCDKHEDGCGAASGWCFTKEIAAVQWNRRAKDGKEAVVL